MKKMKLYVLVNKVVKDVLSGYDPEDTPQEIWEHLGQSDHIDSVIVNNYGVTWDTVKNKVEFPSRLKEKVDKAGNSGFGLYEIVFGEVDKKIRKVLSI